MGYLAGLVFIGIGVYALYWGFNRVKFKGLTEQLRTSYIQMLSPGLVQVKGRVVADKTLTSPYSKTECVYFKYSLSKPAVDIGDDSQKLRWEQLGSGEQAVPFKLNDGTGEVCINPDGVEMDLPQGRNFKSASGKSTSMKERMEKLKEADRKTQESTGKKGFIRKIESNDPLDVPDDLVELEPGTIKVRTGLGIIYNDVCIEPGDEIMVIGQAKPDASGQAAFIIEKDKSMPVFLISKSGAPDIQAQVKSTIRNSFLIGTLMIFLGILILVLV